jgi:hypothetical protein
MSKTWKDERRITKIDVLRERINKRSLKKERQKSSQEKAFRPMIRKPA